MNIRALTLASMFLSLCYASISSAQAAPGAFKGYCMVVQEGNAPGSEVNLQKGATFEIIRKGDVSFRVSYGDVLGEKNVFQLIVIDTVLNKQSVTNVFVENEFPRRIDHVSVLGSISCSRD